MIIIYYKNSIITIFIDFFLNFCYSYIKMNRDNLKKEREIILQKVN